MVVRTKRPTTSPEAWVELNVRFSHVPESWRNSLIEERQKVGLLMDPDKETEQYRSLFPRYARFTSKMELLLRELLQPVIDDFSIESRPKDPKHFKEKITRGDKSYIDPLNEVTDLAGLRVVLTDLSAAQRVEELLDREFVVDKGKSSYKIKELDVDRFGYLSDHLIVSLREDRAKLSEWREFAGLSAEVQVRTNLQHAWAVISRRFAYKVQADIPKEFRRRLNRLSALFELADEELDTIAKQLQQRTSTYKEALREGERLIEINVDSLKAYIETSGEVQYWNRFLTTTPEIAHRVESWGDLSRDVRIAKFCGLQYIEDVNRTLNNAHGWGEDFFTNYFKRSFREHHIRDRRSVLTVVNGVVSMLMIATYADKFNADILNMEFGWGGGERILDSARGARKLAR